jgi:hypothetical protein
MPVLQGAMSYQRFRIAKSELTAEQIVEKLRLFKFRPLHEKGDDNETAGWVAYQSEYDHEKDIETSDTYFDHKMILSLRVDTFSLPKALLKSMVKKSLSAYFRDHRKMADKTTRKEIELAEAQGLRARILPKTRLVEAVWSMDGDLRVFSRSQALVERFLGLFQDTFLLRPERFDCAAQSYGFLTDNDKLIAMDALSHTPIFMPPMRVDVQ